MPDENDAGGGASRLNASGLLNELWTHVWGMPGWHRKLLTLAVAMFGLGSFGSVAGYFRPQMTPAVVQQDSQGTATSQTPQSSRELIDVSAPPSDGEAPAPPPAPPPSFQQRVSPWAMRVGASFIGGFVIGWIFRTFVRIATMITGALLAVLMMLSYFNVVNIDLTAARTKYESSVHWVLDQAGKLKDAAMDHLPSSTSSGLGAFVGFRRKRMID